jgi:hypothetical protein
MLFTPKIISPSSAQVPLFPNNSWVDILNETALKFIFYLLHQIRRTVLHPSNVANNARRCFDTDNPGWSIG